MRKWYMRMFGGDPINVNHYILIGSSPPACPGTGKICAIYAISNELGQPIISSKIRLEMITALNTGITQPHVLLRSFS